jgi:hypothetical protein
VTGWVVRGGHRLGKLQAANDSCLNHGCGVSGMWISHQRGAVVAQAAEGVCITVSGVVAGEGLCDFL